MTLTINGASIVQYIAFGGIKWQRSDIDGPNTGRGMDGKLIRDRIAIKARLDVTCRPLTAAELSALMSLIEPEWVTVRYTNPMTNSLVTKTMYSNNVPATFLIRRADGTELWSGVTFPLIEE